MENTVFLNFYHTKPLHVTQFLKSVTQSLQNYELMAFEFHKTFFFKTLHTILYLRHKNVTGSNLFAFSKTQPMKMLHSFPSVPHSHSSHVQPLIA